MPRPWYADGLRFSCTACGKCCTTHDDYALVYLTRQDITRLSAHFGLTSREFLGKYTERDGLARVLKWPRGEHCVFLEDAGCTVYDARPSQCRTWPFWEETLVEKVWFEEVVPFCPGAGEGRLFSLAEIASFRDGKGETSAS